MPAWGGRGWPSNVTRTQAFLDHYPVTKYAGRYGFHGPPSLAPQLPGLLARFDWYLPNPIKKRKGAPENRRVKDPKTVFALPTELRKLLRVAAQDFDPKRTDRVVLFAGEDIHMTAAFGGNRTACTNTIGKLSKYFKSIFYVAQDFPDPRVKPFPIGLAEHYLRHSLPDTALKAIMSARVDEASKPRMALAAWGSYHDFESAAGYRYHMPKSTRLAFESRWTARKWSRGPAGRFTGVDVRSVEETIHPKDWFTELAKYRFLLSPLGDGIQSSKTIEALLVLTVPIVQRGPYPIHDRLARMGFPMVVIANWDEITRERFEEWWRALSPRLESFRHNCVTTDAYWRLVSGLVDYCD